MYHKASWISNKVFPFVSGTKNIVNNTAHAHTHEKNQNNTCPPTVSNSAPNAVDVKNPKSHDVVIARVEPLLLTLVVNTSPMIVFGIIPRPVNTEFHYSNKILKEVVNILRTKHKRSTKQINLNHIQKRVRSTSNIRLTFFLYLFSKWEDEVKLSIMTYL